MAKLWSSLEGINGRVSNARESTAGVVSPGKGGFRHQHVGLGGLIAGFGPW